MNNKGRQADNLGTKPDAYQTLRVFITQQMKMAALYQPIMLRTLIEQGGSASLRDIAAQFLARDESQLEYYGAITRRMPGRVLGAHGLVQKDGDSYTLIPNVGDLTAEQRQSLLELCDTAVSRYITKRGNRIFAHRRMALGEVSGTIRYEVLRRAGRRCELCGVVADERVLHVDHILPKKHGGKDEIANYQALCFKCNGNKGANDDTDFRVIRSQMSNREDGCPFCIPDRNVVSENELAFAIRDRHPVTKLHTLIIPKRHTPTYFDLYDPERRAMSVLLDEVRREVLAKDTAIEGFNIGLNCGEAAGQTVMHCHMHVIPRRTGDTENPRGGVRGVIPDRASY